jgi:hypothetical protein
MSRRDIVVNTLLGIFLFVAALLIFLLFVAAFWLGLAAIKYLADRFFPGLVLPKSVALLVLYGVSTLVYGVGHLRHKHWRNAFLCLAVIPVIMSAWLADPHSPFGRDDFVSLWLILIALFTPDTSLVPRIEFFLGASIVGACVVINSGLVGANVLAHAVSNCTLVAAFVLLAIQVRRRTASENATPSPGSQ